MAGNEPYGHLVGPCKVYIAPVGTAVPAVNAVPTSPWTELGETDGEQEVSHAGTLTFFYDNDHQGPVKAVRPQEDPEVTFTLVNLTLENYGAILDTASDVTSDAGPPATKKLPVKRGSVPTEYALILTGSVLSPYGAYPGMYVFPRGVFDGEPAPTFSKDGRAALECSFRVLEDDNQAAGDELGWIVVQTA